METAGIYLQHKLDKFYLYACFTICEYTLFAYFFYTTIKKKRIRYVPLIGTIIFYVIATFNFLNKNAESFDSLSASVEAILIIIYSIMFLYDQIRDPAIMFVYNTKKFWIVIALFIYFSSTLFLFLYAAGFTKQEHSNYWVINNSFEILKNVFFCISFAMKKRSAGPDSFKHFNPDIL